MKLPFLALGLLVLTNTPSARSEDAVPKKTVAPDFIGKFLGMEISAEHLGVVLDISESMNPSLPAVKEALLKQMPKTPVLHVDGCRLEDPDPRPRIVGGVAPETVTAIAALGEHAGAKAVLWISDQGDPHNRDGIEALDEILEKYEIRLFLLSLKGKPTPSLRRVTIESEGNWEVVPTQKKR